MNLLKWLFIWRSPRREALSLYRQGLAKSEKQEWEAAVVAYTAAIGHDRAPEDVRAMALYNRALLWAAQGETVKAAADLNAIMAMPISVPGVTTAARRRLERLQHRKDAAADARSRRKPTS
jgi:hypothetical protein